MPTDYDRLPDDVSSASFELSKGTDLRFADNGESWGGDLGADEIEPGALGVELASSEPFEPLEFGSVRFTPTGLDLSGVESAVPGTVDERFDPGDLDGWDIVDDTGAELPDRHAAHLELADQRKDHVAELVDQELAVERLLAVHLDADQIAWPQRHLLRRLRSGPGRVLLLRRGGGGEEPGRRREAADEQQSTEHGHGWYIRGRSKRSV